MQRVAALGALTFFVVSGLFAVLYSKDREQVIVTNRAKLQAECVKRCSPLSATLVDVRQLPNRPATVRGNHIIEVKCECS